ncbi:hypothetical protein GHK29_20330 [Sinorhizobium medicae]|nr:hypothetical protein [Sinorhizobium medicae]
MTTGPFVSTHDHDRKARVTRRPSGRLRRMIGRRWTFLAAASIAGKRCVQSCPPGRQNAHALLLNVKMEAIAGV